MLGIPTIFQEPTSADTEKIEIEQLLGASDISDDFDIDTADQSRVFNVKDYLPTWLVDEHDNGNTLFVKFMQYYYDWLYNPEISNIYNNRVFDFIDIEKIIDPMVTTALNSHVPGLAAIFETYRYKPHLENVKSLIKNIKRDIYQRKGTANSASILFGTLFPEVESVSVGDSTGVEFNNDTYYTNLSELANIMIHEKACITVFGDSINNPGTQTGNMRHGYIREWKPNYWRGIVMHPSSGNRYDSRFVLGDIVGNPDGEDHDNNPATPLKYSNRSRLSEINPTPEHGTIDTGFPPGNADDFQEWQGAQIDVDNNMDPRLDGVGSAPNQLAQIRLDGVVANSDNFPTGTDENDGSRRIASIQPATNFPSRIPNDELEDSEEDSEFGWFVGNEQTQEAGGSNVGTPFYQSSNFIVKFLVKNAGGIIPTSNDTFEAIDRSVHLISRSRQHGQDASGFPSSRWIEYVIDSGQFATLEHPVGWDDGNSLGSEVPNSRKLKLELYFSQFATDITDPAEADGSLQYDTFAVKSIFLGDETINGMVVDYLGAGGWKTKNHSADNFEEAPFLEIAGGDNTVTDAGGNSGRGWYSDESLMESLKLIGTNVALIWIGTNDALGPGGDADNYKNNLEAMIDRIRTQAVNAGVSTASEPLRILLITTYVTGSGNNRTTKDLFADVHKNLAIDLTRVSHINLHQKIMDIEGTSENDDGGWSQWRTKYLSDGVHPNTTGAKAFAAMIWEEIQNAASGDEEPIPNGFNVNLEGSAILTGSDGFVIEQEQTNSMITDIFQEFIEPAGLRIDVNVVGVGGLNDEEEDTADEDFNAS